MATISEDLYETEDGKCPVADFIESLDVKMHATRNPSLDMLKRLAAGMGMQLKLEFIPDHNI